MSLLSNVSTTSGRILVVDCGLMFPDPDMPGVDLVLPDFTYLRENADRLTHAAGLHVVPDRAWWVPPKDPHRAAIGSLPVT